MWHNNELGYNSDSVKQIKKIRVGTSNPDLYSNCNKESISDKCNNCESYIVKLGIGKNHEFIDSPLAAWFLNNLKLHFITLYPKDGYLVQEINQVELNILGSASPLVCGFESIFDIFKDSTGNKYRDVNINMIPANEQGKYLGNLKLHLTSTDPESIADYFIGQYLSGGGDPNPGNFGFSKIYNTKSEYKHVIAKVDLGASFKRFSSDVKGDTPTLKYNKYAFEVPTEYCGDKLYDFAIKNGNMLMPGAEYDGSIPEKTAMQKGWKYIKKVLHQNIDSAKTYGQGNTGFYNGYYNKKEDIHGIDMSTYVKEQHFKNSIDKVCNLKKENMHSVISTISKNIYDLLSFCQQSNEVPIIHEGQESFNRYIDEDIMGLIYDRYDCICQDFINLAKDEL